MAELLLELLSEEIPARMQKSAAKDLEKIVVGELSDRGLLFESARSFSGPRRIGLALTGLPAKQKDTTEERKGPRVSAPASALSGFVRSTGVPLEQCEKRRDDKGEFYLAVIRRQGRNTSELLGELLPEAIAKLSWPKSMRWGTGQPFRWVRPLHRIVCTFDGEIVEFTFAGVNSGNRTLGHRFLSSGEIEVRRFEDYKEKLRAAHVMLEAEERKDAILHEVKQKSFALGLDFLEDEALLDEVVGLAEWPSVLIGSIDEPFMALPPEVLRTSMRTHQKYFALREPRIGRLAPRFALVSNMPASGDQTIVAGNERVLRSRLADAKFFFEQDAAIRLEDRVSALGGMIFHAKLGSQRERVSRIEMLASRIALAIGAEPAKARRAALLAKADLTTGMVGEFPELQGVMGRYYALSQGEDAEVADAIRDHYRPLGVNDDVPRARISIAVGLADKLDSLFAFFSAGERPSGSGDPFALRRAALGVLRTVLENGIRLDLMALGTAPADGLFEFFVDRLKVVLRKAGTRHDVIDAVFGIHRDGDFFRLVARAEALQNFLGSDDGANLLIAYRRAANILKSEEKKDQRSYDGDPDPDAFVQAEEKSLFVELATAAEIVRAELAKERFAEAMSVMARLRRAVDLFFEKVTVNATEASLRQNRLLLLSHLRATMHLVADFSRIEG